MHTAGKARLHRIGDVVLAQFAGALQAPLVKTANLLQALPRNMAYGLSALIDLRSADTADAAA